MKKLFFVLTLTVTSMFVTGCATRTQTALLAGGAGVVVGSMLSQPRPVYVSPPVSVVHQEQVVIVNEQCNRYYTPGEQQACIRGARQRYYEEQRRRENEAYRQGLGR